MPLLNGPTEFGDIHPIPIQWTTKPRKNSFENDIEQNIAKTFTAATILRSIWNVATAYYTGDGTHTAQVFAMPKKLKEIIEPKSRGPVRSLSRLLFYDPVTRPDLAPVTNGAEDDAETVVEADSPHFPPLPGAAEYLADQMKESDDEARGTRRAGNESAAE